MQVNWNFNANQYEPNQGMGIHPPAQKIPFVISNTSIQETKDKNGAMLVVEFTSPLGIMIQRYNIHNQSPKAVEIAYGQLSALCRAVSIYQIDGSNECAALRGGKGVMDIGYQKDEEPNPQFPDRKGYTELKRVYDAAGNEPGKVAQQAAPQQTAQGGPAPLQQQPGGNWGAQANPAQQAPQAAANPAPQQGGPAWQPGGAAPAQSPPWGSR